MKSKKSGSFSLTTVQVYLDSCSWDDWHAQQSNKTVILVRTAKVYSKILNKCTWSTRFNQILSNNQKPMPIKPKGSSRPRPNRITLSRDYDSKSLHASKDFQHLLCPTLRARTPTFPRFHDAMATDLQRPSTYWCGGFRLRYWNSAILAPTGLTEQVEESRSEWADDKETMHRCKC